MPQDALRRLTAGESLSREEATGVMRRLMDGQATPVQTAALLIALRMKPETVEEVTGFALAMRARAVAVRPQRTPLLDTCGTGGSACRVFNVSTAAAFVAAAAGIAVAKHGNRAVTGVCGSADVLEALGARLDLTPEQSAEGVDTVGLGFLFAPGHHPALRQIGAVRRELGIRTVFNLLGPLANPASAAYQVMGVYDARLGPLAAQVLRELGSRRALVLHADIGLDEISTIGPTQVSELRDGQIRHYTLTPRDLGLTGPEPDPVSLAPRDTPAANAALLREVLEGRTDGDALARHHLVAVNAAASLRVMGLIEDWAEAARRASQLLREGRALAVLERYLAFTRSLEKSE